MQKQPFTVAIVITTVVLLTFFTLAPMRMVSDKEENMRIINDSLRVIAGDLTSEYGTQEEVFIWLKATVNQESEFNPDAINPHSGAFGLIQWTAPALKECGISKWELKIAGLNKRLHYTRIYFIKTRNHRGPPKSALDTYFMVFYPKAMGQPEDFVLFAHPSKRYTQNPAYQDKRLKKVTRASVRKSFEAKNPEITETWRFAEKRGIEDAEGEWDALLKEFRNERAAKAYLKGYVTHVSKIAGL